MTAAAMQHPRTLLGAAYLALAPARDAPGLRLKAEAACALGYYSQARRLWETMARAGDAEALRQLARLAERGLGEEEGGSRTRPA